MSLAFSRIYFCVFGAVFVLLGNEPVAGGSMHYTYDVDGRLETVLYEPAMCIAYSHDVTGNRVSQTNSALETSSAPTWGAANFGCFRWAAQ